MKKIFFSIILLFTGISLCQAQDIQTIISTIPNKIIFGLTEEQKGKLASDMQKTDLVISNSDLYEEIKRLAINNDYISLETSKVAKVQIKLLPLINDSKIICVVKTASKKMSDSRISFYTTKWAPINQSDLVPKPAIDWFIKADADRNSDEYKNAIAPLDMTPVTFDFSADNNNLIAKYDIKNYLSDDDYKKLQPFLNEEPKSFTWDKVSFK